MKENQPQYFNNNGTDNNPNLVPKPSLCITCKINGLKYEEILCNLTRADQQGEEEFICEAYEPIDANEDDDRNVKG